MPVGANSFEALDRPFRIGEGSEHHDLETIFDQHRHDGRKDGQVGESGILHGRKGLENRRPGKTMGKIKSVLVTLKLKL